MGMCEQNTGRVFLKIRGFLTGTNYVQGLDALSNNALVIGNGKQDVIMIANGNNQIYANTQMDIATALAAQKTAIATGQKGDLIIVADGNNTIVGGNGNDAIVTGTGNNLIVCGPGAVTVIGGVETLVSQSFDWFMNVNFDNHKYDSNVGIIGRAINDYPTPYFGNFIFNGRGDPFNADGSMAVGGNPYGVGNDTIYGGTGNSVYFLSNGDNWLDAGGGNDTIVAGVGNNTIFGGRGNDTILGGGGNNYINLESGNDFVVACGGNQTIIGGSGNDTIYSGQSGGGWADSIATTNNYIYGGSGNSRLYGSGGSDTLIGGTGNASIYGGNGNEYIVAGDGNVSINGGNGTDIIDASGTGNDTIFAGSGSNTIYGGDGSDSIVGSSGNDIIFAGDGGTASAATVVYAGSGNSTIYGGAGVNQIYGGSGNDTLVAGSGTSTLQGGSGTEVMYSADGNTTLIAGTGSDTIYGGSGTDVLQGSTGTTVFVAGSGNETIMGGSGINTYVFDSGFGNVVLQNTQANDTFIFGAGIGPADLTLSATFFSNGSPALLIQSGNGGQVIIEGGLAGSISQFTFADGTVLTLNQLMAQANTVSTTIVGVNGDLIFSAIGSDTLTGGSGNDTIYGWNGGNTMNAGTGNQILHSQSGNDTLTGGSGNDTLISAAGTDTLIGGTGNTTFSVNSNTDLILAISTGSNTNTVESSVSYVLPANVQNLTGTGSADLTLAGNNLNNIITANNGNDTLIGGGSDTLVGGTGYDTFIINNASDVVQAQSTGNNTVLTSVDYVAPANVQHLIGTGSADLTLTGSDINNVITANSGNDTLIAGSGIATFEGLTGSDTFVVNNSADVVRALYLGAHTNTVQSSVNYSLAYSAQTVQNLRLTGSADLTASGNSLNNLITANNGNDTLTGGGGFDTLIGGTGLDTFVMGYGTGTDVVVDSSTLGAIVKLKQGVALSDLIAKKQGNDLLLQINGTSDSMLIQGYYLNPQTTWAIQDTSGNTSTPQAIVDTISPQSLETQLVNSVIAQTQLNIINNRMSLSGGTLLSDNTVVSLVSSPSGSTGVVAYRDTVNTSFTSTIYYSDGSSSIAGPSWTTSTETWILPSSTKDLPTVVSYSNVVTLSDSNSASSTTVTTSPTSLAVSWTQYGSRQIGSGYTLADIAYVYSDGSVSDYVHSGVIVGYETIYATSTTSQTAYVGDVAIAGSGGSGIVGTPLPTILSTTETSYQTTTNIQQSHLDNTSQTVNANGLMVFSSTGNDTIYNASFAYGGSGNDTLIGGGTLMAGSGNNLLENGDRMFAGSGNDTLIGGNTMFAGSGADQIFAGTGSAIIMVDPIAVSTDLIGGAGDSSQVLDKFYQSMGISDWQQRYLNAAPDMYYLNSEAGVGYFNAQTLMNKFQATGLTLQQVLHNGWAIPLDPLPVLLLINNSSIQPSSYYSSSTVPVVSLSANDYQALAPLFAQGILPQHTVSFGQGVTASDLKLSWGTTVGSIAGLSTDPRLIYTTLNISWGANNQSIRIMIPHSNDPLGSGISQFTFADGSTLNMAQMIARAQTAPGFDPQLFQYQLGMGAVVFGAGYGSVNFGPGITAGNTQFVLNGSDLYITDGTQGDSALVQGFAANGATGTYSISQFKFADGSQGSYINDGQGNASLNAYDSSSRLVGDFWQHSDGSYGNDTYNADGSSSKVHHNPDGSYYTFTQDVTGKTSTLVDYDANGKMTGEAWNKADGSWANYAYFADGSSNNTIHNADGSFSNYFNNGQGSYSTLYYDVSGNNIRNNWHDADGSHGTDNNNADGSYYGTYYYPDGNYYTYTQDAARHNYTELYYTANGNLSGSYSYTNDGLGNALEEYFDSNGIKLSDNWYKPDGTYGSDILKADGSSTGTSYNVDGSYSSYTNNGLGTISTTQYDATGIVLGSNIANNDGLGNTGITLFNATGTKLSDTWTKADGTYGSDTFTYQTDGSYLQQWSKSDGSSGTLSVDSSGLTVGDSIINVDGSQAVNAGGNHLALGTAADNTLTAQASGNEILIGGLGNDSLTTGPNTNLIAFNKGDGTDTLYAVAGANNVLSLGGNFAYNDLTLQKNSNDLILNVSATDSITFKDWYAGNHNIVDLQVIAAAMGDYAPGSTDVLRNSQVEEFDFQKLVAAFDTALAATPTLSAWGVTNALLDAHLAGSDTAALGGDLAFSYGTNGNLTGMGVSAAENTLNNSQFAAAPQTLNPWATLNTGVVVMK
jgi:Ca2+-binding RTX toxin-like protein